MARAFSSAICVDEAWVKVDLIARLYLQKGYGTVTEVNPLSPCYTPYVAVVATPILARVGSRESSFRRSDSDSCALHLVIAGVVGLLSQSTGKWELRRATAARRGPGL